MKNLFYIALAILMFASCQQQKIGFINNGTVINDFEEKIAIEAKYQERDKVFRKKYDSVVQALQFEAQKAQARAKRSSQAKAQEMMAELQQKQQQLGQQLQIEQQQLQSAFQAEIDSAIVKVKDFVKDYGKANGYTYILGTTDAAASVIYGTEENDLTEIIVEALNAEHKK